MQNRNSVEEIEFLRVNGLKIDDTKNYLARLEYERIDICIKYLGVLYDFVLDNPDLYDDEFKSLISTPISRLDQLEISTNSKNKSFKITGKTKYGGWLIFTIPFLLIEDSDEYRKHRTNAKSI